MRRLGCGTGGTAGWIEGKEIERSEAGVQSSTTAVLFAARGGTDGAVVAELARDERRDSCSCWAR